MTFTVASLKVPSKGSDNRRHLTRPQGRDDRTLQPDLVADSFKIARIQRDRDQAGVRLARDRDMIAFHTTMKRLDAEETAARSAPSQSPTAAQARAYLEDLPRLWKETSPEGRRGLAQAIFDRVDVLGVTDYTITLTPEAEAHGFVEAFGPEFTCSIWWVWSGREDLNRRVPRLGL